MLAICSHLKTPRAVRRGDFEPYIELSDSTVIVHVESDYMVNFACVDASGARALAVLIAHTHRSARTVGIPEERCNHGEHEKVRGSVLL
jgi:hypothetical protein